MEKNRYYLRPVDEKEKQVELYQQFHLPFYQEDASGNSKRLVCSLEKDGVSIGIGVGKYDVTECQFWVLMFYIEKQERTMEHICYMIEHLLLLAQKRFQPEKVIWEYEVKDLKKDSYLRIMKKIPEYRVIVHDVSKSMRVWTDQFYSHRHGSAFYGQKTLEKKGFSICLWKECQEAVIQQFVQLREEADEELQELLPFVGEDYETDTSTVLLQKESGKVCGWMICRQISEEEVEIRRWYTLEDYRKSGIGLIFGAYMLKLLGSKYGIYRFQMHAGNDSMKGFTEKYFKEAIIDERYVRYMEITKSVKIE